MLASLFALSVLTIASPDDEHVYSFDDVELTIDFSSHGRIRSRSVPDDDILRSRWTGRINKQRVQIELYVYDEEPASPAPEEALIAAEEDRDAFIRELQEANTSSRRSPWRFDEREFVAGPYGPLSYAVFGYKADDALGETESYFVMAGGAARRSYTIEVSAKPPLDQSSLGELKDLLKTSVRYVGELDDREWTDDEAKSRWERDAPEDLAEDLDVLRTEHFLILTNSSGKKKFSKELEKSYDAIRKMTRSRSVRSTSCCRSSFSVRRSSTTTSASSRSAGRAKRQKRPRASPGATSTRRGTRRPRIRCIFTS